MTTGGGAAAEAGAEAEAEAPAEERTIIPRRTGVSR
jgi:hypothetical protein